MINSTLQRLRLCAGRNMGLVGRGEFSRTCVTRGVRRVAEFLPRQRMAKRIHRQHRSITRMSAWYLLQACDNTGHSCNNNNKNFTMTVTSLAISCNKNTHFLTGYSWNKNTHFTMTVTSMTIAATETLYHDSDLTGHSCSKNTLYHDSDLTGHSCKRNTHFAMIVT